MAKVSIIIRTKNEEVWISSCLNSILNQTFKDFQIVIVDNQSTDLTLKIIENFPVKMVKYSPNDGIYKPGESLNKGIKSFNAEYYAFISAHCITKNEYWLDEFIEELESNNKYAGVYGKQEPLAYSSSQTKRDLAIAFGTDPRTQFTDPFFHNANSIIRKEALFPHLFNEKISNIEDRDWANRKIEEGWLIRYSAKSTVYHYHGIHHDNNPSRLNTTVNVLNEIGVKPKKGADIKFSLVFILSLRSIDLFDENMAKYLIKELLKSFEEVSKISKKIKIFIVSSKKHFNLIDNILNSNNFLNIDFIHIPRDLKLDKKWISILDVMQYSIEKIKIFEKSISHICYLDPHYIFRNPEDMKLAITKVKKNFEKGSNLTILFGEEIPSNKYLFKASEVHDILSESFRPSSTKTTEDTRWRIHSGYCTIFSIKDILSSALFSNAIELISLEDNLSTIRIKNNTDLKSLQSRLNINSNGESSED